MFEGRTPRFVTAAEVARNFGMWQDRAGQQPLVVTHHGRPRVMLVSVEDYERLAGAAEATVIGDEEESARLSVLLGHVGQGFLACDTALRVVRVNPLGVALLGRAEERLVGRPADEAVDGNGALLAARLGEVLRTGEEASLDLPAGRHGERRLRLRIFPWPDGVAATFRSVSGQHEERCRAQERLARAQARAAHGRVGAARLSPRGTFEEVEGPVSTLTGFAADRLSGVRLTDLLALPSRPQANAAIEDVLSGRGARAFDAVLMVNGGADRPVRIALAELRDGFAVSGATVLMTARD